MNTPNTTRPAEHHAKAIRAALDALEAAYSTAHNDGYEVTLFTGNKYCTGLQARWNEVLGAEKHGLTKAGPLYRLYIRAEIVSKVAV